MSETTAREINGATLALVQGNITQQATEAIVNAANSSLAGGGGVDGAIHRAAGPELVQASRPLAPCPPGRAVITPGFRLKANWVIHTVGPIYRDGLVGEAEILAKAYRNSLRLAIEQELTSVAFPSISTGAYGYPIAAAAEVALTTVADVLATKTSLKLVRFVLFSQSDFEIYRQALSALSV